MQTVPQPDGTSIAERYWTRLIEVEPLLGSAAGERHSSRMLPDFTEEGRDRRAAAHRWLLKTCPDAGGGGAAGEAPATTAIRSFAESQLHLMEVGADRLEVAGPVTGPLSVLAQMMSLANITQESDAEDYVHRLVAFPRYIASVCQYGGRLVSQSDVLPAGMVDLSLERVQRFLDNSAMPDVVASVVPEQWIDHRCRALDEIRTKVVPALWSYLSFLRDYRGVARPGDGMAALQDGFAVYEACMGYWTGRGWAPGELEAVADEEGSLSTEWALETVRALGATSLRGAVREARKSTRMTQGSGGLLELIQQLVQLGWSIVDDVAKDVPSLPCEVRQANSVVDPEAIRGLYRVPSDGSRPGVFYFDAYAAGGHVVYNLPTVVFHETVPGHHLQTIIQQAQEDLPQVVRACGFATGYATVEGWAVYAEGLAEEHGLYKDRSQTVGYVQAQQLRALRLVIDTGLHLRGWSRAHAARVLEGCGLTGDEVTSEVDRTLGWPGQASSYRLGLATIRKCRELFLGGAPGRSTRDFHTKLLSLGALPLDDLLKAFECTPENVGQG
jgi:uncharacterized protein (DUF885 family)